jgi:CDGSH-type Zn-finger protein
MFLKPKKKQKVVITKNGPLLVCGNVPLDKVISVLDDDGEPLKWEKKESYPEKETYSLCRCGESKDKPYCDSSHVKVGFNGTETASRENYLDQSEVITGPEIDLTDFNELCSLARFCHREGGTWNLVEESDDQKSKEIAIQQACDCPGGRLVAWDKKSGKQIEPDFELSISITEDPGKKVSGPVWLKGNVPLESSDGFKYEIRNRIALCRCGESGNKPFCDGSHIPVKFSDGDETIT